MADRFFCPDAPVAGRLILGGDEAHHLTNVRRLGPGDPVEVFDGRGGSYRAEVVGVGKRSAELKVVEALPERRATGRLTLATAVPKGDRFDWLVEKATELGVDRLVPLRTDRSVVDPRGSKLDRLRRHVVEACKQSGRARLMELVEPQALADYLRAEPAGRKWLAHPGGEPIGRVVRPDPGGPFALVIGPEGGFTDDEAEAAREAGWAWVGLGPTTLRVETAAIAGAALILAIQEGGDG